MHTTSVQIQTHYYLLLSGLAYVGTICQANASTSVVEMADLMTLDASTAAHGLGHG